MRFLADERLYSDTDRCLRWMASLPHANTDCKPASRERCHLYWKGDFSLKQAFVIKSFLCTQDLDHVELWLWLDDGHGYAGHEENAYLRPLLPYVQVRRFDTESESAGTPLATKWESLSSGNATEHSDLFRHLVLFKYGGIYADIDSMFLRDLQALPVEYDEFCYQWSSHVQRGTSAVMRLKQGGDTALWLLNRAVEVGTCHPRPLLSYEGCSDLDLLVLPCFFFDPMWAHFDRKDRYEAAPFDHFDGFFAEFQGSHQRQDTIRSYRDFFTGAFGYQWHNRWGAPHHARSYFGLFNAEFDRILGETLGIETSAS